jgi:diaminohydroxyphosphoribosylaminopyrimidine deaminase/5-amino-6-(5-phosphoribosylamino)uracil reductase
MTQAVDAAYYSQAEHSAMLRAIELAGQALGRTSPNPVVGAVLLDAAGNVIGEGKHEQAGRPHAEVVALQAAGERARGGTMVVTLEPCTHTGRTGPCVEALRAAGVARVVVGVRDPDPPAAGGAGALRAAGVEVVMGVAEAEARWVNRAWLTSIGRARPYVTWKFAATLDGRSAADDGSSRWITGPAARADVHRLRSQQDAVMCGVGTVLTDDPELTVRLNGYDGPQPLRVVLDSAARTPAGARVRNAAAPTWIVTAREFPGPDGRIDLDRVFAELFVRDCRSVFLEGGPTLAGAAIEAGLVDEVVGYLAPALLGAGSPALRDAGIHTIAQTLRLSTHDVTVVGEDVRITAVSRRGGAAANPEAAS